MAYVRVIARMTPCNWAGQPLRTNLPAAYDWSLRTQPAARVNAKLSSTFKNASCPAVSGHVRISRPFPLFLHPCFTFDVISFV